MWHISRKLVVGIFGFHVMQTTGGERDTALDKEEEEMGGGKGEGEQLCCLDTS